MSSVPSLPMPSPLREGGGPQAGSQSKAEVRGTAPTMAPPFLRTHSRVCSAQRGKSL